MEGLRGKSALVTGASSGIGQAIAVRLAEEGVNVAINFLGNRDKAVETGRLAKEGSAKHQGAPVETTLVQADVSQEDSVAKMFDQVIDAFGRIDILVNNSGIQISGASHEAEIEDFDRVIAVNLRGAYLCAKEVIRHFLLEGHSGVVINVSSVHEVIPKPNYIGYSVSKGGLGNLTRTLALEYAAQNIRVNAVAPGATVTPINKAWTDDPEQRAQVESHIPMRRAGTAEEIAGVVAFLTSDEAAYITGQTIYVDGGLTLYADFRESWSSGP